MAGRRFPCSIPVLLLAAMVCAPAPAAASQRCSEEVGSWTTDWAARAAAVIKGSRCPQDGDFLLLELDPGDGSVLVVELTRRPGRSYLQVNESLGLSPVAQLEDFSQLPPSHQRLFNDLAEWVGNNPERVAFGPAPAVPTTAVDEGIPEGGWLGPWLFVAALAAALAALIACRSWALLAGWQSLLLLLVSLAGRLLLGAWGPVHPNYQGALWLTYAIEPRADRLYGPGYAETFHWLARLAGTSADTAIFASMALLSALSPLLLACSLRLGGLRPAVATLLALALALDPVSIFVAASEQYIPLLIFFLLLLILLLQQAFRQRDGQARLPPLLAALAAALVTAHVVRIHPAGWPVLGLAVLLGTTVQPGALRRWFLAALAGAALVGLAVLTSYGADLWGNLGHLRHGTTAGSFEDLSRVSWPAWLLVAIALSPLPLLFVPRLRHWLPRWLAVSITLALFLFTRHVYSQSPGWQANYDRLYLVPLLLALPPALALLPDFRPLRWLTRLQTGLPFAVAPAACLLVLLQLGPGLFRESLQVAQYRFGRTFLLTAPRECLVAFLPVSGGILHGMPSFLPTAGAGGGQSPRNREFTIDDPGQLREESTHGRCLHLLRPAVTGDPQAASRLWLELERTGLLAEVARQTYSVARHPFDFAPLPDVAPTSVIYRLAAPGPTPSESP